MNPYSGTKTTRKLNFDNLLDNTSMDAELAKALQDTEAAVAATFATEQQDSVLGVATNHNSSDIKGDGKNSGETAADYAHVPGNGKKTMYVGKPPSNDR